jgi:transcriptional regulatory protein GAL4
MKLLSPVNPSAQECYNVLQRLCGPFLQSPAIAQGHDVVATPDTGIIGHPTEESPQTQINNVYSMMWPNANDAEVDILMQGGLWTDLFPDVGDSNQQDVGESAAASVTAFPWS